MNRIRRIRLDILTATKLQDAPIKLEWADVAAPQSLPLAVIRFSENGKMQPLGLRLDLDKKVFIDHLDEPKNDEFLSSIAKEVAYEIFRLVPAHAAQAQNFLSVIHNAIVSRGAKSGLHMKLGDLSRILPEDLYPVLWKSLGTSWENHKPYTALRLIIDVLYDLTAHRLEREVEEELKRHVQAEKEGTQYF